MSRKKFVVGQPSPPSTAETDQPITAELDEESIITPRESYPRDIPIRRLRPNPKQARELFDPVKLQELADGMKEHGFRGRLPVRPHPTEQDVFELVYGERRWRAAALAGLTSIPCDIGEYSDDDMEEIGLLENVQREDLTNLELGKKFANLLTLKAPGGKPKYSVRSLAKRLGKDKSYVEDRLKYVTAPEDVQQLAITIPDVSPRIIRELSEVNAPEERAPIIQAVETGNFGFRDVRDLRKQLKEEGEPTNASRPVQSGAATTETSAKAARLVALRRLQRENKQMQDILGYWRGEAIQITDEEVRRQLLTYVETWKTLLLEIQQAAEK